MLLARAGADRKVLTSVCSCEHSTPRLNQLQSRQSGEMDKKWQRSQEAQRARHFSTTASHVFGTSLGSGSEPCASAEQSPPGDVARQ